MSEQDKLTDEIVRSTFQWGSTACGCCAEYLDEDGEEFDAWLAEHDAALIEGLADEIAVETDSDAPDDFLRGFDAGSDAVYAALREKARQRREEQDHG